MFIKDVYCNKSSFGGLFFIFTSLREDLLEINDTLEIDLVLGQYTLHVYKS